jgi:predicted acetylornithine/succinylornithine family transaminase
MADLLFRQASELVHISNLYYNEPLSKLAALLTTASGLDRAYFCNSGAEANETAIKMARKRSYDQHGPGRHVIISAQNSFHGRTMGAISATGQPSLHKGFDPLLPGFVFVPFGSVKDLTEAINEKVCAIMLEPIQGEGGVLPPPDGYLQKVYEICKKENIILILDEIQTGLGRTGKDFAFRHFDILPDILTLGKALGCGYPVGAVLAEENVASALSPGSHSTTIGGAPLAMALGLELAQRILDQDFLKTVADTGFYFQKKLQELLEKFPNDILEVRGLGLMLGLVLKRPSAPVGQALFDLGFLVNSTASTVIRMVPPLIVNKDEINLLIKAIEESLVKTRSA